MPSGEANPIEGESEILFEGETYRFVFDWAALVAFEKATGISMAEFMAKQQMAALGGPPILLHHAGEFMRCGLMRHHPDMTAEFGCQMFLDQAVKNAVAEAMDLAMPDAKQDGEGEAGEP